MTRLAAIVAALLSLHPGMGRERLLAAALEMTDP